MLVERVNGFIVGLPALPHLPEDLQPPLPQTAHERFFLAIWGDASPHVQPRTRLIKLVPFTALLVVVLTMLRWFEHRQVYMPDSRIEVESAALGRPCEDVFFTAADGVRLNGWFFPANSPRGHLAILLLHGNAGNISHRLNYCQAWLELGVSVLLFDYRGYGRSEGRPDEEGTYRDAQAADQWLVKKGFAPDHIIALGKSLGGGIASELAVRETIGGLILQNTFTSIPDVGTEIFPFLPVRWLAKIRYDTHSKLPRVRVPVLVAHSRQDELIGFHHGERNFAAANEPKMFLELQGGHNESLEGTGRAAYLAGLEKYLDRFFPAKP